MTKSSSVIQSLEGFLTLDESDQSKDNKAIVLAIIDDLQSPYTTDLGSGTLQALLSSGRLENLENKRLRTLLTAWEGVIGEVSDDEANNAKMVFEIFIPYLVQENYSLYEIDRSSRDSPAIQRLLTDDTFRHLVSIRYGFKRHLAREFEQAIAASNEIIAVLDESIE